MLLYKRDNEIALLQNIEKQSATTPQLTVVGGRKRVGKTSLLRNAFGDRNIPVVYFFVERKNEFLLCNDLARIASNWLKADFQTRGSFADIFTQLLEYASSVNYTLIIDECQNLMSISANIFSRLSDIWKDNKKGKKINLIFCGSNHSQMTSIFYSSDAPFSHLIDHQVDLSPFPIVALKQILASNNSSYTADDLLAFAMITGGVASYVRELVDRRAFTRDEIFKTVLSEDSIFINEGRDLLIEELGRDSQTYFSILYAISEGKTTRGEITAAIGVECGGYLDKLERIYGLITRHRPYLQPDNTRNVRYGLRDNFLSFWFRYIYSHRSAVEFGDFEYVLQKIDADFMAYSEIMIKKYFRQLYRETGQYDMVVDYWERGNANALDLIAVNDKQKSILIANCSRTSTSTDIETVREYASTIMKIQKDYKCEFKHFSLDDM